MNTKTSVYINDLRIRAYHGVLPEEHITGNDYVVNIKVDYPWQEAMDTDDVMDTISYAHIAEIITEQMHQESQLLEHVAGRIIKAITNKYPKTESITLNIKKQCPPMPYTTNGAGVEIVWNRD